MKLESKVVKVEAEESDDESEQGENELQDGERRSKSIFQPTLSTSRLMVVDVCVT